jgi:hypothetical protein
MPLPSGTWTFEEWEAKGFPKRTPPPCPDGNHDWEGFFPEDEHERGSRGMTHREERRCARCNLIEFGARVRCDCGEEEYDNEDTM